MLARAGGTDHVRAARLGDLHGDVSDTAGRRMDQYPLSRLQVGVSTSACQAVRETSGSGARLHVVDLGRFVREGARGSGDVLGVRAVAPYG